MLPPHVEVTQDESCRIQKGSWRCRSAMPQARQAPTRGTYAFLYQEEKKSGEGSTFFKLISR